MSPKEMGVKVWIELNRLRVGSVVGTFVRF